MSLTRFPFGMMIWVGILLSCLLAGAVSPLGVASGLFGALLISTSLRCLSKS
jgi:hypothetical protein